ncbi:MAG: hypothetical protein U0232_20135 [Thermomicrobiales bacterium]
MSRAIRGGARLARDRDLRLSNNGYAPWILARVQYPEDAWGHEFPDNGLDRLVGGTGQPAARRHALPVVAGPGVAGEIGIVNTASTATEIVVRVDGATGEGERITLGPAASRLIAIPAGADWRGATVEASQPVGVAVRLTTATGALDGYGGAAPSAQFCVVVPSLAAGSEARLFLRNDESGPVGLTVRRYDSDGRETAAESPTMLANGTLVLPLPGQEAAQTVCVVAERPVAAVGLARLGEAGLLALPALATVVGPLAIPAAPTTTHETGGVFLIVHNPGEGPVRVRRAGDAAPLLTLAPRATGQVRLAAALAAAEGPVATLEADGPVVAAFLQAFERHRAVVAPLEREGDLVPGDRGGGAVVRRHAGGGGESWRGRAAGDGDAARRWRGGARGAGGGAVRRLRRCGAARLRRCGWGVG